MDCYCIRDYTCNAAHFATDDFYLFYNGSVDMQIRVLLTRSQCRVSDTQVTVKACGHIVS